MKNSSIMREVLRVPLICGFFSKISVSGILLSSFLRGGALSEQFLCFLNVGCDVDLAGADEGAEAAIDAHRRVELPDPFDIAALQGELDLDRLEAHRAIVDAHAAMPAGLGLVVHRLEKKDAVGLKHGDIIGLVGISAHRAAVYQNELFELRAAAAIDKFASKGAIRNQKVLRGKDFTADRDAAVDSHLAKDKTTSETHERIKIVDDSAGLDRERLVFLMQDLADDGTFIAHRVAIGEKLDDEGKITIPFLSGLDLGSLDESFPVLLDGKEDSLGAGELEQIGEGIEQFRHMASAIAEVGGQIRFALDGIDDDIVDSLVRQVLAVGREAGAAESDGSGVLDGSHDFILGASVDPLEGGLQNPMRLLVVLDFQAVADFPVSHHHEFVSKHASRHGRIDREVIDTRSDQSALVDLLAVGDEVLQRLIASIDSGNVDDSRLILLVGMANRQFLVIRDWK